MPAWGGFTKLLKLEGVSSAILQVEVNRALYMVESTREKLPQGFSQLRGDLAHVVSEIAQGIQGGIIR